MNPRAVAAVVVLAACALVSTTSNPPPATVKVLQLNLCHSGIAGCFTGDRVLERAIAVIEEHRPQVLSVNEACSGDVEPLRRAMGAPAVVFAAAQRRDGSAMKCRNGQDYGNIVMVTGSPGAGMTGRYAAQVTGDEKRVWACLPAGWLTACGSHLTSRDAGTALSQCVELMSVATGYAATAPVVVAGDLNLRHRGTPNVQHCNPAGFYRKGDGDVQHVFASTSLSFVSGTRISMSGSTDHPGWLVTVSMA